MLLDVLAFGAHPDDIELTCAGTLIKLAEMGYTTGVIALTRGEKGSRGTPEIREREFEQAGKIMGLTVRKTLDIPDGNIQVNWENKLKLIRELRQYQPQIVFLPYWRDRHPDHGNTSRLVQEAAFQAGLKQIDTDQPPYRPARLFYYPCHYEFTPTFIVDVSAYFDKKIQAIQAYKSQFYHPEETIESDEEKTFSGYVGISDISSPEFIDRIITRAKYYGSQIGVSYGEPFWMQEPLAIADLVAFFGNRRSIGNTS